MKKPPHVLAGTAAVRECGFRTLLHHRGEADPRGFENRQSIRCGASRLGMENGATGRIGTSQAENNKLRKSIQNRQVELGGINRNIRSGIQKGKGSHVQTAVVRSGHKSQLHPPVQGVGE